MTFATFLALLLFSFVSSITPGPNNIMLFASGVNFGLRRTWPHAVGIALVKRFDLCKQVRRCSCLFKTLVRERRNLNAVFQRDASPVTPLPEPLGQYGFIAFLWR